MRTFCVRCVNSSALRPYLSGWKWKNVAKLAPHQQIFVGAHVVVATVASSNLAKAGWKKPFATHLRLQLEMQRMEKRKTGAPVQATQPGNDMVCSTVKREVGIDRLFFCSLLVQL